MAAIMIALMLAAAPPSAEAERLGRRLADAGTLAALLPLIQAKEVNELVVAHPELNAKERDDLRNTAKQVYQQGSAKLLAATGHAYAARLSISDLRKLIAFQESPAARHYQAAVPAAIAATMQEVGPMDFKGEVVTAYCKQTGKLCPAK
jgi:hypothetical protein